MIVAVAGASGLIGSALTRHLRQHGHDVIALVRRPARSDQEVTWDPAAGKLNLRDLEGVHALVNLAGAGVGDRRWTDSYKALIRSSRVETTRTLARAAAHPDSTISVLLAGSAMGYYGDTGEQVVDEQSPNGVGFLPGVVRDWEAAADPAREAGVRVVHSRSGLVVSRDGGAFGPLFRVFRLGIGGKLGDGHHWWSFVSMRDELAGLEFLLHEDISGPVNLTAPNPVRNAEITAAMGEVLHRPAFMRVPAAALRVALGEMSSELLGSARVLPTRLTAAGFQFQDPTIREALAWAWSEG